MKVNIVIAGAAGQGLKTLNNILSKIFFRLGYDIYSTKDYMSRIRGGHNFMSIRIGNEKITSSEEEIDLLIALNSESIEIHKSDIKKDKERISKEIDRLRKIYDKEIDADKPDPKYNNRDIEH